MIFMIYFSILASVEEKAKAVFSLLPTSEHWDDGRVGELHNLKMS